MLIYADNGTADPNDAFWVAQTYFLTGHYLRAERILTEPLPSPVHVPSSSYLGSHHPLSKGKGRATEDEDDQLADVLKSRPYHGFSGLDPDSKRDSLIDQSLACRYLAAQCLVSALALHLRRHGSLLIARCIKRDMTRR